MKRAASFYRGIQKAIQKPWWAEVLLIRLQNLKKAIEIFLPLEFVIRDTYWIQAVIPEYRELSPGIAKLASQDDFNQMLLRAVVPLFTREASEESFISVDEASSRYLNRGADRYSFLYVSISPAWRNRGRERPKPFIIESGKYLKFFRPQFDAFKDRELIGLLLEGTARARKQNTPLHIRLVLRPWNLLHIRTAPRYNYQRHELTLYLTPTIEAGSVALRPASNARSCGALLSRKLMPYGERSPSQPD
jgi:hypothetical protein